MMRPTIDAACVACGHPYQGSPTVVPFAHHPHFRLGGQTQDVLCLGCWRWALLWSVGQGRAADRLVAGIATPY